MGPHRGVHVCVHLYKRVGGDMGSQIDVCACTDVLTHSNQGLATEDG